ncbi:MAG: twin-arginine translocase subunit TatC [Planctomycetes bacterium]|nr:twin-arginine translocase subunit TatC [Planctomycetota bacterium]
MAKRMREEDYFAHTTMTFGEHLEELRKVLFRAVIGLGIGFLIGLAVAKYVVRFIERPLERAMTEYYVRRDADAASDSLVARGMSKSEADAVASKLATEMIRRNLTYTQMYIEADEVRRVHGELLRLIDPSAPNDPGKAAEPSPEDDTSGPPSLDGRMIRIRVWSPVKAQITALSAEEPFMIWLKAAFVAGLVLSSPYVFYQIWTFIAAGLYPHEQRYIHVFLPFSIGLFILGASTAFFLVFDPVLTFLMEFNRSMNIDPDPRITNWIGFVLFLPLGFGIAFQLPLVMLFLHRVGIIPIEAMLSKWRIAVLAIFVISMVLTPADPISMLAMAIPLTFLYFVGIVMCRWMPTIGKRSDELVA